MIDIVSGSLQERACKKCSIFDGTHFFETVLTKTRKIIKIKCFGLLTLNGKYILELKSIGKFSK